MKENKQEKMKIRIAEFIGELRGKRLTINGESGRVIIGAESLIKFLQEISKYLK